MNRFYQKKTSGNRTACIILKWLRYYLDFCVKYSHPISQSKSLPLFETKLREKHQTDMQVRQASHAVSLFYEIAGEFGIENKESAGQQERVKLSLTRNNGFPTMR